MKYIQSGKCWKSVRFAYREKLQCLSDDHGSKPNNNHSKIIGKNLESQFVTSEYDSIYVCLMNYKHSITDFKKIKTVSNMFVQVLSLI